MSQTVASQAPKKGKSQKRTVNSVLLGSSELIRNIKQLLDKDLPQSQAHFSERLTQNMDFSSSLKLSELHGQLRLIEKRAVLKENLPEQASQTELLSEQIKALNAAYSRVQRSILQSIEQSFDPNCELPRFPLPKVALDKETIDLSAYQSFYIAQQKEMSAKIQGLRTYIRSTLEASTMQMAKLALLDKTLEETIGMPLRTGFSAVSKVLQKYIQKIERDWCDQVSSELSMGTVREEFHAELRQLLLAELNLRLQPVLGLLDAFKQEVR